MSGRCKTPNLSARDDVCDLDESVVIFSQRLVVASALPMLGHRRAMYDK